MANTTAEGMIRGMLHEMGLDGLATWAWNRFKETNSIDLVKLEMEDRPEYKHRFAGRLARLQQGFEMTEGEQIAWEKQATDIMHQAGMPATFYNHWSDFSNMIAAGVSPVELGERVNNAYIQVSQAPEAVRKAMYEYYGVKGDAALASLVLDANKAAPAIMHEIGAAEVGGYLAQQGVRVTREVAEQAATATQNQVAAIKQGSEQVGQWNAQGQFDPRFGEPGVSADVGVEAALMGYQKSAQQIAEQSDQRAASMQGAEHFDPSKFGAGGLGQANK